MGAAREDVDGGWCVCVSQGRVEEAKGPVGNSRMMARKCKLREKVLLHEANEKGKKTRVGSLGVLLFSSGEHPSVQDRHKSASGQASVVKPA